MLRKILSLVLNYDKGYRRTTRTLARRVLRDEETQQVPREPVDQWSEVPITKLDSSGYVPRLEKQEGDQRSRTTKLSEQSKRMVTECEEIPDPWDDILM
tara:strand:- start:14039 stop:14335 length:297 start_codon:yes stop_codon:yes gene_type:complete